MPCTGVPYSLRTAAILAHRHNQPAHGFRDDIQRLGFCWYSYRAGYLHALRRIAENRFCLPVRHRDFYSLAAR